MKCTNCGHDPDIITPNAPAQSFVHEGHHYYAEREGWQPTRKMTPEEKTKITRLAALPTAMFDTKDLDFISKLMNKVTWNNGISKGMSYFLGKLLEKHTVPDNPNAPPEAYGSKGPVVNFDDLNEAEVPF